MKKKVPAKRVTDKAIREELLKKVKASLSKPSKAAGRRRQKDFTQKNQNPYGEKTFKG